MYRRSIFSILDKEKYDLLREQFSWMLSGVSSPAKRRKRLPKLGLRRKSLKFQRLKRLWMNALQNWKKNTRRWLPFQSPLTIIIQSSRFSTNTEEVWLILRTLEIGWTSRSQMPKFLVSRASARFVAFICCWKHPNLSAGPAWGGRCAEQGCDCSALRGFARESVPEGHAPRTPAHWDTIVKGGCQSAF